MATGTNSEENALRLYQELNTVMGKGQFELRKWASNSRTLLKSIPITYRGSNFITFDLFDFETTKVLGLKWDPSTDVLSYNLSPNTVKYINRAILSEIT